MGLQDNVWTLPGATSSSLVYECKTILLLAIQIPSLHTTLAMNTMSDSNYHFWEELEVLDEQQLHLCSLFSSSSLKFKGLLKKSSIESSTNEIYFSNQMTNGHEEYVPRQT